MDLGNLNNDASVIDIKYFKILHLHDTFNPNGPKVFGLNYYLLFLNVFNVFSTLVFGYATIGLFVDLEDQKNQVEIVLTTTIHMEYLSVVLKLIIFTHYSDNVWNLFTVFRVDFLASDLCRKHTEILHKIRSRSSQFIFGYTCTALLLLQQWATFPYTYNKFISSGDPNQRLMNIFSLRFPVSTNTFNECYMLFYTLEFLMAIYLSIGFFLSDVILISFCCIMIAQHDVLAKSFQEVGYGKNEQTGRFRF